MSACRASPWVVDGVPDIETDLVVHHHGRDLAEGPTLVFLHGLTDSGSGWPEAVRHWERDYAIVALDQRGHGQSPRFTAGQLEQHPGEVMVADAVSLLEQLPHRPVVIGHSLGGAVGLAAAVRRPELLRALVLEDPAPRGPEESQRDPEHTLPLLAGVRRSRAAADDDILLRQRREDHPDWPESELLVTGRAEQQTDEVYLEHGDVKPVTPWTELFPRLLVPTLVVSGDALEEVCVDRRMEATLQVAEAPHVSFVRIPGAGHCVRRDQPAAFYELVDDWLDDLSL